MTLSIRTKRPKLVDLPVLKLRNAEAALLHLADVTAATELRLQNGEEVRTALAHCAMHADFIMPS